MRVVQSSSILFSEADGGVVTLVAFGDSLEIWMLCTIRKYIFLAFLEYSAIVFPFTITMISLSEALGLSSACR